MPMYHMQDYKVQKEDYLIFTDNLIGLRLVMAHEFLRKQNRDSDRAKEIKMTIDIINTWRKHQRQKYVYNTMPIFDSAGRALNYDDVPNTTRAEYTKDELRHFCDITLPTRLKMAYDYTNKCQFKHYSPDELGKELYLYDRIKQIVLEILFKKRIKAKNPELFEYTQKVLDARYE